MAETPAWGPMPLVAGAAETFEGKMPCYIVW